MDPILKFQQKRIEFLEGELDYLRRVIRNYRILVETMERPPRRRTWYRPRQPTSLDPFVWLEWLIEKGLEGFEKLLSWVIHRGLSLLEWLIARLLRYLERKMALGWAALRIKIKTARLSP